MIVVTDALARRLEYAEAIDAAGCVDAACILDRECEASSRALGGGVLTFCGAESPLTHAIGVGMHGPVTLDDILGIEEYFESRGASVAIDMCPHADPSVRELLSDRGYRIAEFHNVLVRSLPGSELLSGQSEIEVRTAAAGDADLYIATLIRGFFERDTTTEAEHRLGAILFRMPCSTPLLAFVNDRAVAAGSMSVRNGVASLFGDATLMSARGIGAQSALIAHRLRMASDLGCEIAVAGTQPGSRSQRNYQRLGFEVAYSKATMVKRS